MAAQLVPPKVALLQPRAQRLVPPAPRPRRPDLRALADPSYAPCRAFIDRRFATRPDMSAAVTVTAGLLTDPHRSHSNRKLSDEAIRTI